MPDPDLEALIEYGREDRNLEYKSSFPWNDKEGKKPRARVTKACLAMANLKDGGVVVVGVVEDPEGVFTPAGVTSAHVITFTQDIVQSHVNEYADPFVDVTVMTRDLGGIEQFVVIQIRPFENIPVICRQDGLEGLRTGAIYTRARKKHETIEVPSQTQMREILERATQLGVRKFIQDSRIAGLIEFAKPETGAGEQFDQQLEDL